MADKPYIFAGYAMPGAFPDITRAQACKLTHLNLAFGVVREGIISIEHMRPAMRYLKQIREWNPALNILLSTGGGDPAQKHLYGQATKDAAGVARIVSSAINIVREFDLDGLDGDWERPLPEERSQYTAVLNGFRAELDKYAEERGRKCYVTIAAERLVEYMDCVEVSKLASILDYVFLMTYDARWNSPLTGHHSNTYSNPAEDDQTSAEWTVELFHREGILYSKLVPGAGFYSHRYNDVQGGGDGYLRPYAGGYVYGPDYTAISLIYEKSPDWVKYWDDVAKAPWLFNGRDFITYEDPRAIACKCDYIKQKGLAGIMYWEHNSDKTGTLFDAIYDILMI